MLHSDQDPEAPDLPSAVRQNVAARKGVVPINVDTIRIDMNRAAAIQVVVILAPGTGSRNRLQGRVRIRDGHDVGHTQTHSSACL